MLMRLSLAGMTADLGLTSPHDGPARVLAASECAIDIDDVVARYPRMDHPSIDHVTLKVRTGALLGLLGPNGAGKTTLLSLLCALMRPQSGAIRVQGMRFDDHPEAYKDLIGLVPQALALYPRLTGTENLAVFGQMSGLSGRQLRARMDFAIDFAGLNEMAQRRVETYSGGLRRRLNLATALLPDPPVLVLDEPTVGIDPQSRHAIHENLRQLSVEGKTIIYTSHYLDEIEQLCDDIAILDRGRLIAQGSLGALLARFTGNRIDLRLEPQDAHRAAGVLSGEPGVQSVTAAGSLVTLATDDPHRRLPAVLAALEAAQLRPVGLSVGPRDLEQAFLSLTGTELRDEP
ncbi:MAG: ABC transporter ATP-binding protein [Gammaproteobacteria bacterium]|nr:ABC transporter ATP-binding protein [Gammaproteobacteria bacterium]